MVDGVGYTFDCLFLRSFQGTEYFINVVNHSPLGDQAFSLIEVMNTENKLVGHFVESR